MWVCNMCKKPKRDVTTYSLKSTTEHHTFYHVMWCIECRDKVFDFIKETNVDED
jgi:hypothetical protein